MMETDILLQRVEELIEDNINEKLTIPYIADNVYISSVHLQRLFKQKYGIPIAAYIRTKKLQHAAEEIMYTNKKIDEISYELEFGHESSFIRSFKREFGITPSQMRKQGKLSA